MSFDTGYDLFYLAADLHLRAQQFSGFFHFFAGDDLTNLELHFSEIIEGNLFFCIDINYRLFRYFRFCLCSFHSFHFFQNFFQIQTLEQDLRFVCYFIS